MKESGGLFDDERYINLGSVTPIDMRLTTRATPLDLLPTTPSEELIDDINPIMDPVDSSFKMIKDMVRASCIMSNSDRNKQSLQLGKEILAKGESSILKAAF